MTIGPYLVSEGFRWIIVTEIALTVSYVALRRMPFPVLLVPIALAGHLQPTSWGLAQLAAMVAYVATVLWRVYELSVYSWSLTWGRVRRGRRLPIMARLRRPVLVLAGISLIWLAFSWIALLLLVLFLAFTYRAGWLSESVVPRRADDVRELIARTSLLLILVLVSALVLLLVAGTWSWVEGGTARDVLPQLVAVQLVFGLLPLTALLVVAQLANNSFGPRSYRVLPYWRAFGAVLVVVFSIAVDLWLIGQPQPGLVELAELLASAAMAVAALVSVMVFRHLDWERVVGAFLRRVDRLWLDNLVIHFENPYVPRGRKAVDATADIERLLYLAATRDSDIRRFRQTLDLTRARITDLVRQRDVQDDRLVSSLPGQSEGERLTRERVAYLRDRMEPAIDEHLVLPSINTCTLSRLCSRSREEGAMPRTSPFRITLSPKERSVLEEKARKYTLAYRDVVRAKIVLLAAAGLPNDEIARRLDTRREVVSKWRKRFFEERLLGLEERPRHGRPAVFSP